MSERDDRRIPVTVLTGFLGAGKTTLLNRILTEHHGQRIAIIENEFGEIGIDQALVVKTDEEIFEMNNGCICCTVRGDLIRVLGNLMRRRDRFDRILVETTGMANPGPVAQTFFVDDEVRDDFRLDGIVTLVDAKHLELHLGEQSEAHEQVAFADVLVLNKIDLVDDAKLAGLERRLRGINAMAKLVRGCHADVPLGDVLDVGGFDLGRALAERPTFLEPEYPFEWAGVFRLQPGRHALELHRGPDPKMTVLVAPFDPGAEDALAVAAERALRVFTSPDRRQLATGEDFAVDGRAVDLALTGADHHTIGFVVREPGDHAIFTQHLPAEFALQVAAPDGRALHPTSERAFVASHTHDAAVSSVGLAFERPFDQDRLNQWLGKLLRERGNDIFRMKGILAIAGSDRRFVFQGVHMLFDGRPDLPWGDTPPRSEVVFIGKQLDRQALHDGMAQCLA
ncbi:MAG TPA: GTP-binding protein [Kofleriaceae bacterium]|nr:GTP-binding protein [Kofleriaceae bacterium]